MFQQRYKDYGENDDHPFPREPKDLICNSIELQSQEFTSEGEKLEIRMFAYDDFIRWLIFGKIDSTLSLIHI